MQKIIFVCLGNICRSPMAELIFKDMAECAGIAGELCIDSAGTSDEEQGHGIYRLAAQELYAHGITGSHRARQITRADIADADYIVCMDSGNMRALKSIAGDKYADKLYKLCDFTSRPRDVADPWYTRDFSTAYSDIEDGCAGLIKHILAQKR